MPHDPREDEGYYPTGYPLLFYSCFWFSLDVPDNVPDDVTNSGWAVISLSGSLYPLFLTFLASVRDPFRIYRTSSSFHPPLRFPL